VFRFGDFEADAGARELRRAGRVLPLPEKAFAVLEVLLERAGEPVSREALRRRLWPDGTHVDFDNNLNSAVTRLRAVLGDPARRSRWIETLPRRGYRFRESVVPLRAAAPAPRRVPRFRRLALPALASLGVALALAATAPRPASLSDAARAALDRGRYLSHHPRPGHPQRAVAELERAVRLAPGSAAARGALAEALVHLAMSPGGDAGALDRAEESATLALGREPGETAALRALSGVRLLRDWDLDAANALAERAVAQAPEVAESHAALAAARCAAARFEEAIASARRAAHLDPVSWLVRSDLGFFLLAAGRFAEAESEARAALDLAPDFRPARGFLAMALAACGREREALEVLGVESGGVEPGARLARYWRDRLAALDALPPGTPGAALARARTHARLGEYEDALDWLERSRAAREPVLVYLQAFPELQALRGDPRFRALEASVLGPRG
jgi:DNA-binding winged helix-turn-helix (wHTH) protein/Tfp pilus assembly protein PilF